MNFFIILFISLSASILFAQETELQLVDTTETLLSKSVKDSIEPILGNSDRLQLNDRVSMFINAQNETFNLYSENDDRIWGHSGEVRYLKFQNGQIIRPPAGQVDASPVCMLASFNFIHNTKLMKDDEVRVNQIERISLKVKQLGESEELRTRTNFLTGSSNQGKTMVLICDSATNGAPLTFADISQALGTHIGIKFYQLQLGPVLNNSNQNVNR